MIERKEAREIKTCCATFYQSDIVRLLLGDVLHPGGLELTGYLGTVIGLRSEDKVLDIACGRGASVVYLAKRFGCHVTGLDYSPENLTAAEAHANSEGVSYLTSFKQGDAERLPFRDSTFDAIISECSFCAFPNKKTAAAEMARVLRSDGRLGVTDVTISGNLPDDMQSILTWVACVAGAGSVQEYISIFNEAGFTNFTIEDRSDTLQEMVRDIRRKLLGLQLVVGLGKLDLSGLDISSVKEVAQRVAQLIEDGVLDYTLIAARKANTGQKKLDMATQHLAD